MKSNERVFDAETQRVGLRRPLAADCDEFVALMAASAAFHHPWVDPPNTSERFFTYLASRNRHSDDGFLVCLRATGAIAGVINLNCITRRQFQSAYLGFYIGEPYARQGIMSEALSLLIDFAFGPLQLHRLEANIQPANAASLATAKKCGFRYEGFSPRYLQILGQWRDHQRWALTIEDRAEAQTERNGNQNQRGDADGQQRG